MNSEAFYWFTRVRVRSDGFALKVSAVNQAMNGFSIVMGQQSVV